MLDTIAAIGDTIQMHNNGFYGSIRSIDRCRGMYYLKSGAVAYRHEFRLVKWGKDKVGNTGIGVCAKNGSEG